MTENTQASAEELRESLDSARGELRESLAEQGHLDEREKEAIKDDHEKRMKAAREGGSIRQALTRRKSKVQEVRDRGEELPYLIWSARVRVAELERDYNEALRQELEPQVDPPPKQPRPTTNARCWTQRSRRTRGSATRPRA